TFSVKKKEERIIINPSTKQRMLVPPKLALIFCSCY
ncbi:HU family DNA-binding protein, partial [Bacteroides sp. 214]